MFPVSKLDFYLMIFLLYLSPSLTSTETCSFPGTLSNVRNHWKITSPDYTSSLRHFRRKVDFTRTDMRIEYITSTYNWRPAGMTRTYRCMRMVTEDTFMVSMHEDGQFMHYTCVGFVFRSTNVVQLKLGEKLYYKTAAVCDEDKLHLMDAPLVYFYDQDTFWTEPRNEQLKYRACPLEGGYVLSQWYDNDTPMCRSTPAAPVSVKVENECERGDGLGIMGGSSDCPAVYTGYPLFCLADWSDGEFTYMLLVRELMAFDLLCMRYPTKKGHRFTAHLYVDGVCDSTSNSSMSRRTRRMILNRHANVKPDVCSDDSPTCNEFIPPAKGCDRLWTSHCRHTCHTCPWRRPWRNVTIPEFYRGVFYRDTFSQGEEMVTITDHHVIIPSLGEYELFGESTCSSPKHSHGLGSDFMEFVFIQAFENGCSPRLTIIQLAIRTQAVVSMRLSTSVTVDWKLFDRISRSPHPNYGSLACPTSRKFRKPPINIMETFRTMPHGWFNLIRTEHGEVSRGNCVLPNLKHVRTTFISGVYCSGLIRETSERSFRVSFNDCKARGHANVSVQLKANSVDFECVSSFNARVGRKKEAQPTKFIITRILNYENSVFNESMHCWMYSTMRKDMFLLSRVSDCDRNTEVYFFEFGGRVKHYIAAIQKSPTPLQISGAVCLHLVSNIWVYSVGILVFLWKLQMQ